MATTRTVQLKRHHMIALALIVAIGVVVTVAASIWWGLGAAAIALAISEVIERTRRAANTS